MKDFTAQLRMKSFPFIFLIPIVEMIENFHCIYRLLTAEKGFITRGIYKQINMLLEKF